MPELPEVETVRRTLELLVISKQIASVEIFHDNIINTPDVKTFKDSLKNQSINAIDRLGKYLIFELDQDYLISHLRMEGKFYFYEVHQERVKHTHVVFRFVDGSELHYHDTRKFGKMYLISKTNNIYEIPPLNKLGYEPFDQRADATYLQKKLQNRRITLKQALLDQTILTGLGNIYVDEVCFMCNLYPGMSVSKLKTKDYVCLVLMSEQVLNKAIDLGGTTIRTYQSNIGVTGRFQNELNVHLQKGKPCKKCQTLIEKTVVAQRGTYYCPHCQKK